MQEHVCAPTRLASSMMFEQCKGVRAKASEHMTVVNNLAIAYEHASFICAFLFTQALKHKYLKLSMVIELTIFICVCISTQALRHKCLTLSMVIEQCVDVAVKANDCTVMHTRTLAHTPENLTRSYIGSSFGIATEI